MNSTRIKVLMKKIRLESMHYFYLITRNNLGFKKKKKGNGFSNS